MTKEELKRLQTEKPFKPFTLYLGDGRAIPIPHPELISFHPTARSVIAFYEKGGCEHIDPLLITSAGIEAEPSEPAQT